MSNGDSIANFADDPEWNPALEFGVSRQHVPHRLTLGWMAEVPQKVRLIHGLQLNSVVTVQSGRFNTVFAGSDANGDGNPNSDRPGTVVGRFEHVRKGDPDPKVGRHRGIRLHEQLRLPAGSARRVECGCGND